MKKIEIYTTPICGFCIAAKRLLKKKDASFTEISVMGRPGRRAEMMQRAKGGRTVPQIFIADRHIGGCDELFLLDRNGKLDALLAE